MISFDTHLVACRLLFASSISGLEGGWSGPGGDRDSPGTAGSPSRPAWNTIQYAVTFIVIVVVVEYSTAEGEEKHDTFH
jgi:hypothetical protein